MQVSKGTVRVCARREGGREGEGGRVREERRRNQGEGRKEAGRRQGEGSHT